MAKKKILIVDDEKTLVNLLAMRLKNYGYEVDAAYDAIYAVTQAVKSKPDLVLLDISMPAGGGLTALKNIRNNIKVFDLPIIVMTGRADKETRETAEKLGISGYFEKPLDKARLMEKLREILGEKDTAD